MKKDYSHISIVLDRSGSMADCESETREGFNTFIQKQKEIKGETTVTLVQFDNKYEVNFSFLSLDNVAFLNTQNYVPRGGTALLDAIGRCITETGEKLAAMKECDRPSRVIFVVQTDGFENASIQYTKEEVFKMVGHQQKNYQWDFIFLGANQDAIASAAQLGIHAKSSLSYKGANSKLVFAAAGHYTNMFRAAPNATAANSVSFTETDRKAAVEE